jgi:hypothetical protein
MVLVKMEAKKIGALSVKGGSALDFPSRRTKMRACFLADGRGAVLLHPAGLGLENVRAQQNSAPTRKGKP